MNYTDFEHALRRVRAYAWLSDLPRSEHAHRWHIDNLTRDLLPMLSKAEILRVLTEKGHKIDADGYVRISLHKVHKLLYERKNWHKPTTDFVT